MEISIKADAGQMIITRCELDFTTPNRKHMYSIFGDSVRPDDYLVWSVGVKHKKYQEEIEKFLKENDCVDTTFKCHRFYMTDNDSEKGTSTLPEPMQTHIYRNSKATVRPYYNEELIEKKKKMEEKKNG